jgi:hypothetical protein
VSLFERHAIATHIFVIVVMSSGLEWSTLWFVYLIKQEFLSVPSAEIECWPAEEKKHWATKIRTIRSLSWSIGMDIHAPVCPLVQASAHASPLTRSVLSFSSSVCISLRKHAGNTILLFHYKTHVRSRLELPVQGSSLKLLTNLRALQTYYGSSWFVKWPYHPCYSME